MIYSERNTLKISLVLVLAGLLTFSMVGCGDGGGSTNPEPPDDPPPTGTSWDSGSISPGSSFSFTFENEGMIDYICTIHPDMTGSVTVEEGAGSGEVTVTIDNLQFIPADITIAPGTEVTWVNEDSETHTSTSQ